MNNQLVVAVYRSPSNSAPEFYQLFEDVMEKSEFLYNIIIAGDFNKDWSKEGTYMDRLNVSFMTIDSNK